MRLLEIVIGLILLGGAAWTKVRTYKGHGTKSFLIPAFAIFLVALGVCFSSSALLERCSGISGSVQIGSDELSKQSSYPSNRSNSSLTTR